MLGGRLCFIDTVKPEIINSDIYLYGISENSIGIILWLAQREIYVSGIITTDEAFIGKTFINIPIVSIKCVASKSNITVIYEDELPETDKEYVDLLERSFRFSDIICTNAELFEENFFIYGTGDGACEILKKFCKKKDNLKGFIKTNIEEKEFCGFPVYKFDSMVFSENDIVIISALSENVGAEILKYLDTMAFPGRVYVRGIDIKNCNDRLPILDQAINSNKKILLYCTDDICRNIYLEFFENYKIEQLYEVGSDKCIQNIDSLLSMPVSEGLTIIHELDYRKRYELIEKLKKTGFSLENNDYTSILHYTQNKRFLDGKLLYEKDWHLRQNINFSIIGGLPGWMKYGNEEKAIKRIMVIGNSCSSEAYSEENWISKITEIFNNRKIPVVFFNGSYECDDEIKEIFRFIKHVNVIKPDILISFDGLNSIKKKKDIFDVEPGFDRWYHFHKLLGQICNDLNIRFYPILQPINRYIPAMSLEETATFFRYSESNLAKELYEKASDDDFYYDFLRMFHHCKGMFFDNAHYTERANALIAERIFDILIKDLDGLENEEI
ncbi:hypothetical protein [Butyrivibrio proteoclasticus]|uniref:hypothetical protein n=1 Tax=Butyrivibrio proteoclasticus TaxID=43305 RepID=UPI00047A28AD|nr:hypothetical protein [Butyrivibrio proteoclasticus]